MKIKESILAVCLVAGLISGGSAQASLLIFDSVYGVKNADIFASGFDAQQRQAAGWACLLTLIPFCILDAKDDSKNHAGVKPSRLKELGYEEDEIKTLVAEQNALSVSVIQSHQKLVIGKDDTAESLTRDLKSLNPEVNSDYVEFFLEQNGFGEKQ